MCMRVFRRFTLMRTNIRRALLLLILAVLLPVLALLAFTFVDQFQRAINNETQSTLEFARDNGAAFESYMLDISRQELAVGVALASLLPYTSEQANQYLVAAADYPSVRSMSWLDPRGKVIASSRPAAIGTDLGQEAYFREALKAPGLPYVVSDLLPGESAGGPEFVIARVIRDKDGNVQGVVLTRVGAETIGASSLGIDRPERGRITLFDRQGQLAYHYPTLPLAAEQRLLRSNDPHLDKALAGQESSGALISPLDGIEVIAARVPLKNTGWVAGASRPYGDVMRSLYRSLAIDLAVMLGIAAVSVFLSSVVSRRVTRPLRRLQAQAAAVGKGDLDYRTDVTGITELEELSGALNRMAASLKLAMDEVEARAAENQVLARFPAENPSPVCRISAEAALIYANAAAEPLLAAWGCRVGQQVPSAIRQAMSQSMASGKPNEFDVVAEGRTFSLVVAPVIEAGYANLYGRDVTERRKAQEDLARSNQDLEQFAYVASHDLQEPLRIVAGYIQLLERRYKSRLDNDAVDFINFAVDGANRMQRLIQDLLAYSRLGTRGQRTAPTDCEAVLEHALANLRLAIDESGAVITHDPLPTVTADESQIIQLMQNLIGNAIKFRGERRPEIHVSACPHEGRRLFTVKDNGIGIEAQYLDRIFVIFQRLHGQRQYPGTGIGLALCKRIVERHGGRIWVESKKGEGSTFYFTL
jgi:signal transduction histidine kinase